MRVDPPTPTQARPEDDGPPEEEEPEPDAPEPAAEQEPAPGTYDGTYDDGFEPL